MLNKDIFEPPSRKAWREWLEHHHAKKKEVWLIFTKVHLGKPSITYQEALCEAICFGWIDGVRKRIDDKKYAQRFSPRTRTSKWSAVNVSIAAKLQAEGLMAPAGIAAFGQAIKDPIASNEQQELFPPEWIISAIQTDRLALSNFQNLPPSHQRRYIGWISSAKREDTRKKRIAEAIALLRENKRLGLGPGEVRK